MKIVDYVRNMFGKNDVLPLNAKDKYKQLEKLCVITEELYNAHTDRYTSNDQINVFEIDKTLDYLEVVIGERLEMVHIYEFDHYALFDIPEFTDRLQVLGKFSFMHSTFMSSVGDFADTSIGMTHSYNTIFYSPDHSVAFGYRITFRGDGGEGSTFLCFAKSASHAKSFIRYAESLLYPPAAKNVIHFTSTSDGLMMQKVSRNTETTMDSVMLDDDIKLHIIRSIDQFFNKDDSFYEKYKIPYRRGVLLYGKPGNGKTTLAKAISDMVDQKVYYWQVTEFTNSDAITSIFRTISKEGKRTGINKCVLILEDADSLPNSCRSTFLNFLDGANTSEGIYIIATTNYPEKIDPALMNRAGRFDRTYEIPMPNGAIRKKYLIQKGIQEFLVDEQLSEFVLLTEGYSISTLNEVYTSSALQFHYDGVVDTRKVMSDIIAIGKRQKTGVFDTSANSAPVGFSGGQSPARM